MKNSTEHADSLASLLEKISPVAERPPVSSDPMHVLIESMMMWEASAGKAEAAMQKILEEVVDYNDLRVTLEYELIDLIGSRYPRIDERTTRLRATLRDIYQREHQMTLASVREAGKREVRKYIETLDGITPYAASRVLLLSFETHTIPVDGRLLTGLVSAGAADPDINEADLASWLARQIKASDGVEAHFALQAWVDAGAKVRGSKSPRKKSAATDTSATNTASG